MTPAARVQAAIEILDQILEGAPAEKALTGWARRSRFAGSKDRAAVRDHVFDALRRRNSAAFMGGSLSGRGLMIGVLRQNEIALDDIFTGDRFAPGALGDSEKSSPEGTPPVDLPEWIVAQMNADLGEDFAAIASGLGQRAPVFLRVNVRKGDVAQAQSMLVRDGIETKPVALARTALEVTEGARKVKQSQAYVSGLVELQDASSQALIAQIPISKGMKVLDFCAGGGGKVLAMAGVADAQYYAHDIAPKRMSDLPDRARRAGAKVEIVQEPGLHAPYDLILCDVPCSGSGTWRRTPDAKWRFDPDDLDQVTKTQAKILEQAKDLVAESGVLVYATCSLFASENVKQVERFMKANPEWRLEWSRQFLLKHGGDGFFGAILRRI